MRPRGHWSSSSRGKSRPVRPRTRAAAAATPSPPPGPLPLTRFRCRCPPAGAGARAGEAGRALGRQQRPCAGVSVAATTAGPAAFDTLRLRRDDRRRLALDVPAAPNRLPALGFGCGLLRVAAAAVAAAATRQSNTRSTACGSGQIDLPRQVQQREQQPRRGSRPPPRSRRPCPGTEVLTIHGPSTHGQPGVAAPIERAGAGDAWRRTRARISGLRSPCGRRRGWLFRPCLQSRAALPDPSPRNRASNRRSWSVAWEFLLFRCSRNAG